VQQQLQALADGAGAPATPPTEAQLAALKKLLERVRGSLMRGLADVNAAAVASAAAGQGPASLPGMRLPAGMSKYVDQTDLPGGEGTYAAFQQRYLDQQRQMETKSPPCGPMCARCWAPPRRGCNSWPRWTLRWTR